MEIKLKLSQLKSFFEKKYIAEEYFESKPLCKYMIPLPHVEEPLIDVFKDKFYVRVFMQSHCKNEKLTVNTYSDSIEICKKECYKNDDGKEMCIEKCQKLNLPVSYLQMENMVMKCNNNQIFEIEIPKIKPRIVYNS